MNEMFCLRIIFGKFGVGKGTLNSILGIMEMKDKSLCRASLAEIDELEQKMHRPFSRPPQPNVVYGNFGLKYKGLERYEFDPDRFMLPNSDYEFDIFPPYACFHVEEGQSGSFLSYDWSKFPKPALLAFSRVRHPRYLFTIDLQFITNLNKNMRKFAFEYCTPLNLEHSYNCLNVLSQTKVHVGVFYNYEKAVEFETTQNLDLVEELREITFTGNIYNCFNSYSKKMEFFDVDNSKDFVYSLEHINRAQISNKVEIVI